MPSFWSSRRWQFLPFTKYGPSVCLLLCQSSPTSIFSHSSTLLSFCFLCPFPYLVIGLSSIAKHVNVSHMPHLPMFCCHSFCADTIKNMEKPKNGEELRSFLGLATYLGSNNIPHFSTLVNPLWSLPNSGPLEWDVHTMQVFENLRQELVNIQRRIYFDQRKNHYSD